MFKFSDVLSAPSIQTIHLTIHGGVWVKWLFHFLLLRSPSGKHKKRHGHIAVLFLTNSRVRDVTWNMVGLSSPHRLNLLLLFNSKFIGLSTLKMQTLQVEEVLWLCQISATSCPLYAKKFEIYRSKFALLTVEMLRLILPAFYSPGQPFTLGAQAKMNPRLPEETITVIKWRFLSSSEKQTQLPARGRWNWRSKEMTKITVGIVPEHTLTSAKVLMARVHASTGRSSWSRDGQKTRAVLTVLL